MSRFIWATRGYHVGSRFLSLGGFADPRPQYLLAFADFKAAENSIRQSSGFTALRLVDPLGRCDQSGRPILHDFVLYDELRNQVLSVEDGLNVIWPLVKETYEAFWDGPVASDSRND